VPLCHHTTAAFISIFHSVTHLLTTNPYVIVIALDFSKAFDTVHHSCLLDKLVQLNIHDNIYNWILDYLQDHTHCTLYNSLSSRGGECTSLLGPGEPYTPNSEKDTSCLGPVEPYAPSTHISELIVLAHIGKKLRARRALYAQLRKTPIA